MSTMSRDSATLFLPVSKTDAGGAGAKRTLQCNCGEVCNKYCPVRVPEDQIKKMEEETGMRNTDKEAWSIPLFPTRSSKAPSKFAMIKGWCAVTGVEVSGHSARRSGTMQYTRKGRPLLNLGFLGRGASSLMVQYAEEALEEVPAAKLLMLKDESRSIPQWETRIQQLEEVIKDMKVEDAGRTMIVTKEMEEKLEPECDDQRRITYVYGDVNCPTSKVHVWQPWPYHPQFCLADSLWLEIYDNRFKFLSVREID
jgi:hypothetical protein